ncbi:MAG: homocysteine S-methyltransferase family protein [Bacillota bacterium]|nr:homocysteine S-methyltransferase family protein [Bacillota bacterium]
MRREDLIKSINEGIFILDGATGTNLQSRGMPAGACPEKWALENPDALISLQREYLSAGANAVYTFTLGANCFKLRHYGLSKNASKINEGLARLSRQTAGKAYVGGCIGPLGEFIQPNGHVPFNEAYAAFFEQAAALARGGADFIIIETISDLQEARAAILAAKDACKLPVFVCLTFDQSGRTLTGTDAVTAINVIQSLGVDAAGCNCSTGPKEMVAIIEAMKSCARIPIIAKPNAGLPKLIGDKTVFEMGAEEFALASKALAEAGACLLGGCCGTQPAHIRAIANQLKKVKKERNPIKTHDLALSSYQSTVSIGKNQPIAIIGERINPTGKPALQQALHREQLEEVLALAAEQQQAGADILDVNVGMHGIDEPRLLEKCALVLSQQPLPLCIDSANPEAIERALRIYPGRALINSIPVKESVMDQLFPAAKKYGAAFILLPLDENGVPQTAAERIELINKGLEKAYAAGFTNKDILVDGLTMAVSVDKNAVDETLKVVSWCTKNGLHTVLGVSNVSFGLPHRDHINAAFLVQAAARGLCAAIVNPQSKPVMDQKAAAETLCGRDEAAKRYIARFSRTGKAESDKDEAKEPSLYEAVLKGQSKAAREAAHKALAEGENARDLIEKMIIPALNEVGRRFENKEYFLPQLMLSAESAKEAFSLISPHLKAGEGNQRCTIILATVKGDIHDIGKNIVALMLKNHGFDVVDLGKDVPAEEIIQKAKEKRAKIIGLSALITTTMPQMKLVAEMIREQHLIFRLMIGGAVVTKDYADEIGADAYAKDASEAVGKAKQLEILP